MAGKRKQYIAEFKFKVVLESLQRDMTIEEVCHKCAVHSSVVSAAGGRNYGVLQPDLYT